MQTTTQGTTFTLSAFAMAQRGVPVIPIPPHQKNAILDEWQNKATTDTVQIAEWGNENPNSNLACVAKKDGFWFLDDDSGQVKAIYEKETALKFPETFTVWSSGVKRHYYFRQTDASRAMGNLPQNELFSARVHNQYVVGAGSIHPVTGLPYVIVNDVPIIPAPNELVAWALKKHAELTGKVAEVKPPYQLPAQISKGTRDDELYSFACSLRAKGMNKVEILSALEIANKRGASSLKPQSELERIASSAMKKPAGKRPEAAYWKKDDDGELAITFVCMDDIEAEVQRWLWDKRFPLDTLSTLVGEPDKGKSVIALDIVARLTKRREFPDGSPNPFGHPIDVLLLIAEDSLKTTTKPRLMEAGADMKRVHVLKLSNGKSFSLDDDLPVLRAKLLEHPEIKFIVIDPVMSFLGEINSHQDQEVRSVLIPLRDLAEELRITVLGVAHFNKNITANAINRVGGSIAITAVPRAVWCCVEDPDNKEQYLMLSVKSNLGKKKKGLSYTITEDFIEIKGEQDSVPKLNWGSEVENDANDVLASGQDPILRGIGKAKKWLEEYLQDGMGHLSKKVFKAADKAGIKSRTLKDARQELDVQSKKFQWRWYMRLPNDFNQNGRTPWELEPISDESNEEDPAFGFIDVE